jgi:CII-binding regulator of phage lambda lysogenization HflD
MASVENQILIQYLVELKDANKKLAETEIAKSSKIEDMYKKLNMLQEKLAKKEAEKNNLALKNMQLYNDLVSCLKKSILNQNFPYFRQRGTQTT